MAMRNFGKCLAIAVVSLPLLTGAQEHKHAQEVEQPYAGQQARAIKSLSAQDIATLQRGGGWGLALPAELSGWPGPAHLLELKEELALTPAQMRRIQDLYDQMRLDAIQAGDRFIIAEKALSDAFQAPDLNADRLRALIDAAAEARASLRAVHLSRHLATPEILTEAQIKKYAVLRGYAADPCAAAPDGHDPAMWRRHNNCD